MISKNLLVNWLHGQFYVRSVLEFAVGVPMKQFVLMDAQGPEPFPGVTEEICKFVESDAVSHIVSVTFENDQRVVTVGLNAAGSTHSEGSS